MSDREHQLSAQVNRHFSEISAYPQVAAILAKLRVNLSAKLSYHSAAHTEEVMHEALLFAVHDGLTQREIELVAIAAAFHDAGFLENFKDNEAIGARLLRAAFADSPKFSKQELIQMEQMILDTQLVQDERGWHQKAGSKLSGYLLDADLSNLGRDDFLQRTKLLIQELEPSDEKSFLEQTLQFVLHHNWHTAAAQALRQKKKADNLEKLKALLQER